MGMGPEDRPEPRLEIVEATGSTNADLARVAGSDPGAWPHLSALLARRQLAGRGRSGRTWTTDEHAALTFSILLRPEEPRERWGWIPLLGGAAVVQALRAAMPAADAGTDLAGESRLSQASADGAGHLSRDSTTAAGSVGAVTREVAVGLKWPNDVVHLGGTEVLQDWGCLRKVGGLLAEVLPDGRSLVLGIGINLVGDRLPVPWAGTAADLGVRTDPTRLAGAIRGKLSATLADWAAGTDPRELVAPMCLTLGTAVRVGRPDGSALEGEAVDLAEDGALVVRLDDGTDRVVRAGDVTHLRPA
ncbi:biotin--[acetyl-CoA-carboxylase] ligase [Ruania zhangjianzhongii]|uniref:biotin--[acetyl-CoA-carboxylase] ligase n=1 Tax=Ruania zhangjianzhongii TaxID=2603206 RepID=UPI0011C87232|nr:biotin--[acetyl-CoA-carboxylase] ligase [Ruania zhangjianzhongii]